MVLFIKYRLNLVSIVVLLFHLSIRAQVIQSSAHYAIETTFDDETPVVYNDNACSLTLNSATGDIIFSTNFAKFKTGIKIIDSLLLAQDTIVFRFWANIDQNLIGLINQQNDGTYHKIIGKITVNNKSYTAEAFISIKNLSDKSNLSKALLILNLEFHPKVIIIPYLSDYFTNMLLFRIEDNYVNQNR